MRSSGQCSKDAYAKFALATRNDDVETFLIVVGNGCHDPHRWKNWVSVSADNGRSWTSNPPVVVTAGQVGTGFLESNWPKVLSAETVITA